MSLRTAPNDARFLSRRTLAVFASLVVCSGIAHGARTIESTTRVALEIRADGSYAVESEDPGFSFAGALGAGAADVREGSGTDALGNYRELSFRVDDGTGRTGFLRTYEGRPVVRFSMTWHAGAENTGGFPSLATVPEAPFGATFSGKWSVLHFDESGTEGPVARFDAAGRTYILSAASNFMVAHTARTPAGALESRIHPAIPTLPSGFTHEALLAVGNGINRTFDVWGRALTDLSGKVRPPNDADPSLRSLGYWTDNGAAYYYNTEHGLGYPGTLVAVRDAFRNAGTALGYVQLDSWWYPKGASGDWNPPPDQWMFGIHTYEAHPDLFPSGLRAFQEELGLPLMTHARWIDEKSPYRQRYVMSNNVVVEPSYWEAVAGYLKSSGAFAYEQDWLDGKATAAYTIEEQNLFMDSMARAMESQGLSMQYCMATPRHLMQSSHYGNLTTARLSEDICTSDRWDQFLYSSRLASALGVWPWADEFRSGETGNILVATLSAGVVGVGDALDEIDPANLSLAARPDGVLVKPDTPLVPTDATILSDARGIAAPLVASTSSELGDARAVYVFAHARASEAEATFDPSALGFASRVFVWDFFARSGVVVPAGSSYVQPFVNGGSYDVLVAVGPAGIALVGDEGKFATLGRKRFARVTQGSRCLTATILFAPGEGPVTLVGWSAERPETRSPNAGTVVWDAATGVFRIPVSARPDGTATIVLRSSGPVVRAAR